MTENDLALIKVKPPFEFNESTAPIQLFDEARVKTGVDAVITSWTKEPELQMFTLDVTSKDLCNHYFYQGQLREGHICAGNRDFLGCLGEQGSPLTVDGKLAGITGNPPARMLSSDPIVYADISYYRDWILNKTDIQ